MDKFWSRHIKLIITLLVVMVVVVSCLSILNHYFPQGRRILSPHRLMQAFQASHGNLTVNDVKLVKSWMTFEYISTIFKLPTEFLKDNLTVADPKYPKLSIKDYAKNNNLDETATLIEVQNLIKRYLSGQDGLVGSN